VAAQLPQVTDNVNWDQAFRDSVRNAGLPMRWLLEMEEVSGMREQRAQAQQQMEQQAQQAQMAESAGKLGSIKQDSLVGKALSQNGQRGTGFSGVGLT
jgi:hypothetical protein